MADRARVRIREEFKGDAINLLDSFAISPIEIEENGDGVTAFYFSEVRAELAAAVEAFALNWWAGKIFVQDPRDA